MKITANGIIFVPDGKILKMGQPRFPCEHNWVVVLYDPQTKEDKLLCGHDWHQDCYKAFENHYKQLCGDYFRAVIPSPW